LGASLVVGFAVTLFIGVAVSMFSALFASRTLLRLAGASVLGRRRALFLPLLQQAAPEAIGPLGRRA
jgi:hypothetical protein